VPWVWCGSVSAEDHKEVVRRGYDALSERYDEQYGGDTKYRAWLEGIPSCAVTTYDDLHVVTVASTGHLT
jgi:hypothetical protein